MVIPEYGRRNIGIARFCHDCSRPAVLKPPGILHCSGEDLTFRAAARARLSCEAEDIVSWAEIGMSLSSTGKMGSKQEGWFTLPGEGQGYLQLM